MEKANAQTPIVGLIYVPENVQHILLAIVEKDATVKVPAPGLFLSSRELRVALDHWQTGKELELTT